MTLVSLLTRIDIRFLSLSCVPARPGRSFRSEENTSALPSPHISSVALMEWVVVRAVAVSRFPDGVEHRQVERGAAALAGRDTADHLLAIGDRRFRVESPLLAGEALADDLGVLVDED